MNHEARDIVKDALLGAAAGAVAAWATQETTAYLYKHEDREAKSQEQEARRRHLAHEKTVDQAPGIVEQGGVSGLTSGASVAVERAADLVGKELSEEGREKIERTLGYGMSMIVGAAYALVRNRVPRVALGNGLAFGVMLWLMIDEVGNTALRLTPPPGKYPWPTHRRGLAAHLVFGIVTETALSLKETRFRTGLSRTRLRSARRRSRRNPRPKTSRRGTRWSVQDAQRHSG